MAENSRPLWEWLWTFSFCGSWELFDCLNIAVFCVQVCNLWTLTPLPTKTHLKTAVHKICKQFYADWGYCTLMWHGNSTWIFMSTGSSMQFVASYRDKMPFHTILIDKWFSYKMQLKLPLLCCHIGLKFIFIFCENYVLVIILLVLYMLSFLISWNAFLSFCFNETNNSLRIRSKTLSFIILWHHQT